MFIKATIKKGLKEIFTAELCLSLKRSTIADIEEFKHLSNSMDLLKILFLTYKLQIK